MKRNIFDEYFDIVVTIEEIPLERVHPFVGELYRRHRGGWALPPSVYKRNKNILIYKDSLERNSPYFIDLLKLENKDDLRKILLDIYKTIKIKEGNIHFITYSNNVRRNLTN